MSKVTETTEATEPEKASPSTAQEKQTQPNSPKADSLPDDPKKRLIQEFRNHSKRFVYQEYDGQFTELESFPLDDETKVSALNQCHRCLGIIEAQILSLDPETQEGTLSIEGHEHTFTTSQKQAKKLVEKIGETHRFGFSAFVDDVLLPESEPLTHLPKIHIRTIRETEEPASNHLEVMGQITHIREDSFVALTWDYKNKKLCYTPFSTPYPYPDELGEFAWLTGRFVPGDATIELLDAQAIEFVEPEKQKEVLKARRRFFDELKRKQEEKKRKKEENRRIEQEHIERKRKREEEEKAKLEEQQETSQ